MNCRGTRDNIMRDRFTYLGIVDLNLGFLALPNVNLQVPYTRFFQSAYDKIGICTGMQAVVGWNPSGERL